MTTRSSCLQPFGMTHSFRNVCKGRVHINRDFFFSNKGHEYWFFSLGKSCTRVSWFWISLKFQYNWSEKANRLLYWLRGCFWLRNNFTMVPAFHETCKSDGRLSSSRAPTETLLRLSLLLDASCWPKALLPSCRLQLNQSVRESGPFGRTYHRLLSLFYVGHPADFLFQRFKTPSLINKCCMFISETMMVLAQLDTLPAPHPFCIPAAAAASSQPLFKTKQRS